MPYVIAVKGNLTLKIAEVDAIVVENCDMANAAAGQVHSDG